MKKRFTEERIIRIWRESEAGLSGTDVCCRHHCSEQSFYRWKARFGGMDVSKAQRLKERERQNGELKKNGG
ncbi:MAG TPA: transposase [Pseudomonadales bacterium]